MQRRRNASGKSVIVWALEHSEKDSQEFTQPVPPPKSRASIRAEIVPLDAEDKCWEALALAFQHNSEVVLELPVVI